MSTTTKPQNALTRILDGEREKLIGLMPPFMQSANAQKRFFEFAMALQNNEYLLRCSEKTLRASLYKAAQWALPIDGVHASLIPYGEDCTYVPGYPGYARVYKRSGDVEDVWAKVAFEGEEFEVIEGTDPKIIHRPNPTVDHIDPKKVQAAYACARMKTGRVVFFVLWADELLRLYTRCIAKAKKKENSPWNTDTIEMMRKSPIIRLRKFLSLSEDDQLLTAEQEKAELGEDPREAEVLDDGRPHQTLQERAAAHVATKAAKTVSAQPAASQAPVDEDSGTCPIPAADDAGLPRIEVRDVHGELHEFQFDTGTFDDWSGELIGGRSPILANVTWARLAFGRDPKVIDEARKQVVRAAADVRAGKELIVPVQRILKCLSLVDQPPGDELSATADLFGDEVVVGMGDPA